MLIDAVIIGFVLLSLYMGGKRGFVGTVSRLLSLVISVIVAAIIHPAVSVYVKQSFIGDFIQNKITDSVITDDMPYFVQKTGNSTAEGLADMAVSFVTVLLIVIICFIAVNFIIKALNIVAKLPLISFFNKIGGIAAGLVMGVFLVYVVMAAVGVMNVDTAWMDGSKIAQEMYKNNLLMNMIF